jgi:hypothetical protein
VSENAISAQVAEGIELERKERGSSDEALIIQLARIPFINMKSTWGKSIYSFVGLFHFICGGH